MWLRSGFLLLDKISLLELGLLQCGTRSSWISGHSFNCDLPGANSIGVNPVLSWKEFEAFFWGFITLAPICKRLLSCLMDVARYSFNKILTFSGRSWLLFISFHILITSYWLTFFRFRSFIHSYVSCMKRLIKLVYIHVFDLANCNEIFWIFISIY